MPGAYSITGGLADGADTATLTIRANYLGATVDQTIFVSKAKQGTTGPTGPGGGVGSAAVSMVVTKPTMMIMAYAEGTPVDPAFVNDDGFLTVYNGTTDVTSACTLSSIATSCSGSINTSLNVPVAAHAMGYYRITAMTADNATLVLNALYAGNTYSTTIMLAKARGGYEILGSLPVTNLFDGRIVYLTTDHKLYRYDISIPGWTAAVKSVDLSGLITDQQLSAIGNGPALNDDPKLADPTAWKAWGAYALPTFVSGMTWSTGPTGIQSNAAVAAVVAVRGVPLNQYKTYRASVWAYSNSGTNGTLYLRAEQRTAANVPVGGAAITMGVEGVAPPVGAWTKYWGVFQVTSALTAVGVIINYNGTAGNMLAEDLRVEEVITGDLILARTIDASKILTNTLTANEIAAGAITASEIAANTITGNKMSAGAIITGSAQITDGVIISAKIGLLQVNTANIADLTVGTNKIGVNAVTRSVSSVTGNANIFSGIVCSLSYTPDTASDDIRVDWQMLVYLTSLGTVYTPAGGYVSVRRYMGGVETDLTGQLNWTMSGNRTQPDFSILSGTIVDTVAVTTARTYRLYLINTYGNFAQSSNNTLIVTEMKK